MGQIQREGYTGLRPYTPFIVEYDARGSALWSHKLESLLHGVATGVAVDGEGAVVVGGRVRSASSVGFPARYLEHDELWMRTLGPATGMDYELNAVTVDPDGNVLAAGTSTETDWVEDPDQPTPVCEYDDDDDDCDDSVAVTEVTNTYAQVQMLDALGEPVWVWSSGDRGEQGTATDVEVTSDGRIVVAGSCDPGTGTPSEACHRVFDATGQLLSVQPTKGMALAVSTALGGDSVLLAGETTGGGDGIVELLQQ